MKRSVNSPNQGLQNKGLDRTRPAANGQTGPCRSTQCCAGPQRWRVLKGGVLSLLLSLPGMGCLSCPPTERGYATSQDGALTAVETVHECEGATVADYTEVVLRTGPEAKEGSGGAMVLQIKGNAPVGMEWTTSRALRLMVSPSAEVTTFRPEMDGVTVSLDRREPKGRVGAASK